MTSAKSGSDTIHIHWRIEQWFPDLPAPILISLKKFHDELLKANKTVNLIGVKTIPIADATHFADSILAARVILGDLKMDEVYDFGSGGGFPGVVMAIMAPKVKFHLVETDQRKAEFLKHIVTHLGLKNADVLIRPAEAFSAGSVKCAVSRDLGSLSRVLMLIRRVFSVGGVYYHMKGEEWATEISDIPTQLCSFWQPGLLAEYRLPVGEVRFAVIKTEKIKT